MEKIKKFLFLGFIALALTIVVTFVFLYHSISFYWHFEVEYRESYGEYALVSVKHWNDEILELPKELPNGTSITIFDASLSKPNAVVKELVIPDSYKMIFHGVGDAMSNLEKVTIGSNVSYISGNFVKSPMLSQIVVEQDNLYYLSENNCVIDKRNNCLVMGCKSSKIPEFVRGIEQEAFACVSQLAEIYIPQNVIFIHSSAFVMCQELKTVVLPSEVQSVSKHAFYRCPNLVIYCDSKEKPQGWDDEWAVECKNIIWGNE